ncbi:hypothetical protein ACOSQ2_005512 [Xanthoceras sorbifolium]
MMAHFKSVTDNCSLLDMGFGCQMFNWFNRQGGWGVDRLIKERLDRFFCCMNWRYVFPEARLLHLNHEGSDHLPTMVDRICKAKGFGGGRRKWSSRFHFKNAWVHDEDCKGLIEKAWRQGTGSNAIRGLSSSVVSVVSKLQE